MIETGAIHVCVGMKPTGRLTLSLTNTRTAAPARLLCAPENRGKARRLVTLLFGLCPIAQLVAFDEARAAALGVPGPVVRTGRLAALGVVLEAIVETIRVLVADAARMAGLQHAPEAGRAIGRMRVELGRIVEVLLSADPSGDAALFTSPAHQRRVDAGFRSAETLLEEALAVARSAVYGEAPERFDLERKTCASLEAWARSHAAGEKPLAAAALFSQMLEKGKGACEIEIPFLPVRTEKTTNAFAEELLNRMLVETDFELSPFWQGTPRLTGTLSRMRSAHPAGETLLAENGNSPVSLLGSRLLELAIALRHAKRLLATRGEAPSRAYADSIVWHFAEEESGAKRREAISLVETARGLLAHAVRLDESGEVATLRITSPTEWQFAPYGAGQRILLALVKRCYNDAPPASRCRLEAQVRRVLFGLDPCVPIEFAYTGRAQQIPV